MEITPNTQTETPSAPLNPTPAKTHPLKALVPVETKSTLTEADLQRISKLYVTAIPHLSSVAEESGFLGKLGSKNREFVKVSPPLQYVVSNFKDFEILETHVRKMWKKISFGTKLRWQKLVMDDYRKRFEGLIIGPRCYEKMLVELCCDLYEQGYLVSEDYARTRFKETRKETNNRITSVGFVSGNRVDSLARAVESYGKNCLDHGRPTRIVVCDDSMKPEVQSEYQDRLLALKNRYGFEICYVGSKEKADYVTELANMGFDREMLEFALVRTEAPMSAYGKNRNALSLACVGEYFFSADDDTHCEIHTSPNYQKGINFGPKNGKLQEIKAFDSRSKALAHSAPLDKCFLELHERVLGKSLTSCVDDNPGERLCYFDSVGRAKTPLFKSKGRVNLTFNGLVGDSGSGERTGHLFVDKVSKKEAFQSKEYFDLLSRQREVCKTSDQIMIARESGCMTTFYGLDSTQGLPPFFPHFRMEDAIFSKLNFVCDPTSYQAYLPWQIQHLPLEKREREKVKEESFVHFVSMHEIVSATMDNLGYIEKDGSMLQNLVKASDHMLEFCNLDLEEFTDILLWRYLQQKTQEIARFEVMLIQNPWYPKYWKKEVKTHIASIQNQVRGKVILADMEYLRDSTVEQAEVKSQEHLKLFARMMREWPAVLEACEKLKTQGITLGRTLA